VLEGGPPIHETGDATVESISVHTVESLPIQYQAVLRGHLPDSCTAITDVQQVREATTFRIRMTTQRTQNETCTETATPFEQVVTLDVSGLPLGAYQVAVNELWTSFALTGVVSDLPVYSVVEASTSHVAARSEPRIFSAPGRPVGPRHDGPGHRQQPGRPVVARDLPGWVGGRLLDFRRPGIDATGHRDASPRPRRQHLGL